MGRTSLVVRWLRICLPMQETQVQSLVREDSTCHRAIKPMYHNYWNLRAFEPVLHNKRSNHNDEPIYHNQRVVPARHNQRKPTRSNEDPAQPKINVFKKEVMGNDRCPLTCPSVVVTLYTGHKWAVERWAGWWGVYLVGGSHPEEQPWIGKVIRIE